jgi:anaerobic ribonucleoside-triphosphate reductase activating protein
MSQDTWDPDGGQEVAVDDLVARWRTALAESADGVTVSGGEPLDQPAIGELVGQLAKACDLVRPGSDILLYTGYSERTARSRGADALAAADAVITDHYLAGRPTRLIWRGLGEPVPADAVGAGRRALPAIHPLRITAGTDAAGARRVRRLAGGVPRAGDLYRLSEATRRRSLGSDGSTWSGGIWSGGEQS